jgi:hypothetical protein
MKVRYTTGGMVMDSEQIFVRLHQYSISSTPTDRINPKKLTFGQRKALQHAHFLEGLGAKSAAKKLRRSLR